MSRTLRLLTGTVAACLMFLHVSCTDAGVEPGVESPPPVTQISFAQHIQPIFNNNGCTGCHGGSGGLTLTANQSYGNLVNVNAQTSCSTLKRVLPGNAAQSVLYIRVSSNTRDTQCGSNTRMPKDGSRISQASIDLLADWINEGALNN